MVLLALGGGAAQAQVVPGFGGGQKEEKVEEPVLTAKVVHHSPKAAIRGFMESMRRYEVLQTYDRADLASALSALDLRGETFPEERKKTFCRQFFEVLSAQEPIDYEMFPDKVEGDNFGVFIRHPAGDTEPIRMEFVRVAGGKDSIAADDWKVAKVTLGKVEGWWEDLPKKAVAAKVTELTEDEEKSLSLIAWVGYRIERTVPPPMRTKSFLLENWQWLALAVVSVFGVLLGRLVSFLVRRYSAKLASNESLDIDKSLLVDFERPFSLFVMVWMILFSRPALRLEEVYAGVLDLGCAFFLAFTGVWSAFRMVDVLGGMMLAKAHRTNNRFDDMLVPLMRASLKIFMVFVGVVYVASYLSDDLYGIVAGLSIGSLAVGFAAKDSIENLFGTVTVLLDKPYQLGDWVTVGDIDGSVEHVGFRSTKVRTFYNSVITVPNSRFIAVHVDNMGARRYRRIKTTVSLAYGTPPLRIEAFCEAVRELIRKHPYTRKDYYHVYLNGLGASSLEVLLYCFVETPDWSTELREKHRLFIDLLKIAEGLQVEIAFPTQTIHMAGEKEKLESLADDVPGAERMGRQLADLVMREGMERFEGERPGPVVID